MARSNTTVVTTPFNDQNFSWAAPGKLMQPFNRSHATMKSKIKHHWLMQAAISLLHSTIQKRYWETSQPEVYELRAGFLEIVINLKDPLSYAQWFLKQFDNDLLYGINDRFKGDTMRNVESNQRRASAHERERLEVFEEDYVDVFDVKDENDQQVELVSFDDAKEDVDGFFIPNNFGDEEECAFRN